MSQSIPASPLEPAPFVVAPMVFHALRLLTLVGIVLLAIGSVAYPDRLFLSVLILGYFVFGTGAGALYFLAMHHGAAGGWGAVFKRVPESMLLLIPVGGGLILFALAGDLLTGQKIYPWMTPEDGHHGVHSFKDTWLSPGFFYLRAVLYVVLVSVFAQRMRSHSLAQDQDHDTRHTGASRTWSIAFLVFGTLALSGAAIDWFMSLEPMWYSTMFIVYHFAGNFLTALAVILLLTQTLAAMGVLRGVTPHHRHDLGKLVFAMSTFWMYIWFSQFMLIWYTNIPEETVYFTKRLGEGRTLLFLALPVLLWIMPFFVLLSQRAKRSVRVMGRICVILLLGHWLDLFLMAGGAHAATGFAVAEIGAGLAAVGLIFLLPLRQLTHLPLVPLGDPYLDESRHHHV